MTPKRNLAVFKVKGYKVNFTLEVVSGEEVLLTPLLDGYTGHCVASLDKTVGWLFSAGSASYNYRWIAGKARTELLVEATKAFNNWLFTPTAKPVLRRAGREAAKELMEIEHLSYLVARRRYKAAVRKYESVK